jgi:sugar lactone lactonase YvrE
MRALATASIALLAFAAAAEVPALQHAATLYRDAADAPLRSPAGVACTEDGKLVVADTGNGRLLLLSFRDGKFSAPTALKLPELGAPVRVQIDARGDVLSLDARGHRIARVGLGGEVRGFVEPLGVPGERAVLPVAFRVDREDRLVILDAASSRVVQLDASGHFLRQVPLPKGSFIDVASDARGTLYAVDGPGRAVWAAAKDAAAFTRFAQLEGVASFPSYAAATARGALVVVDSHGGGLVTLGPDGAFLGRQLSLGWIDGALYYPGQLCFDGRGTAFIADRNNDRVQAFAAASH